jgi:glycosyltransferase involved in cell wall biosynthesis
MSLPETVEQAKSPSSSTGSLVIHGVFPPPVTGMSLCTAAIAKLLEERMPVTKFNWSNSSPTITGKFRLSKMLRALSSPLRLLFGSKADHAVFYTPCNAGLAFVFNLLAIMAAKVRGYRCVLHHHYYHYLNNYQWRTQFFAWVLGPQDLQLVLCPDMEHRLREKYGQRLSIAIIPSTIQLLTIDQQAELPGRSPHTEGRPFRLGLICNLQMAKGLDTVVDVLRELQRRGRKVQLVLAGPLQSQIERSFLEAAQSELGDAIDYRGPVYGAAKLAFYQDIDVMLFPTRYPDAQPLVITEAFSYGCPVISYGRGCIPGMMADQQHWSIAPGQDFIEPASKLIEQWMDNSRSYSEARVTARRRYESMIVEAETAVSDFEQWVRGEQTDGFVRRENQVSNGAACGV